MAARTLHRDPVSGRFISAERARVLAAGPTLHLVEASPASPREPTPEEILRNPTERHPRWRLRVFDLCWPWRASRREALRDALASGNARYDGDDRVTYLDCTAVLQQDPPCYADGFRWRQRQAAAS